MSKRQAGVQITKDGDRDEDDDRHGPPDPAEQASAEVLATRKIAQPKSRRNKEESNPFSFGASKPFSFVTTAASTPPITTTANSEYEQLLKSRSINVAFKAALEQCLANDAFADLTQICQEYIGFAKKDVNGKDASKENEQAEPVSTIVDTAQDKPEEKKDFTWKADTPIKFGADKTPVFNFNNPMTSPDVPKPASFASTGFSFGQSTEKPAEKPAFSFGPDTGAPASSTSFSFGQNTEKPAASTSFSFGQQPASTPAFSFGSASNANQTAEAPAPTGAFSFKPAEDKQPAVDSTPKFAFNSNTPAFNFGAKPTFSFAKPAEKEEASEDQEEDETIPEEPRTNDELIAGPGVGEENEETVWSAPRLKLYKFDTDAKGFAGLGICTAKINVDKSTKAARVIARAEGAGQIRLNSRLYAHFVYTLEAKTNVRVPSYDESQQIVYYLLKFREPTDASACLEALNNHKA